MGEFRFRVPADWNLDSYHANAIHLLGLDGIPWPCRIATGQPIKPDPRTILSVTRNNENSGRLYVLFPFKDRGEMLICTGTLPVRDEPYDLLTEIARGTINRLRNQLSIWEEGGLEVSGGVYEKISAATKLLATSILGKGIELREDSARECIELGMNAIFDLSSDFGFQISKFRREHKQINNFWMAANAKDERQFRAIESNQSFDLIHFAMAPKGPENTNVLTQDSNSTKKRLIVGPWLDASVGGMPSRLVDLEDFPVRKNQIASELREDLQNLPPETSVLHVVSGLNGIGHRHLSHPQQLQLTVDLLRQVEESRVEIPTMVSFDFPWAERLAGAVGGVHPLQIADSLLRQGLEISLMGLEINLDYWPNGSAIRDPLQWIDLVDIWGQLGMPIILFLRAPFGELPMTLTSEPGGQQHRNRVPGYCSDENRRTFLETVLPMMVARPAVYGLVWSQWDNRDDDRYPSAGIAAGDDLKQPLVELFDQIKKHSKS
jgi:hypothetical protein